jgi:hypothetical protein
MPAGSSDCCPGPWFFARMLPRTGIGFGRLKPPCIRVCPPSFDSDDRGLPADRMRLLVSVAPVSSFSSAARSTRFPRPFGASPLAAFRNGDPLGALPFDILHSRSKRSDRHRAQTQRWLKHSRLSPGEHARGAALWGAAPQSAAPLHSELSRPATWTAAACRQSRPVPLPVCSQEEPSGDGNRARRGMQYLDGRPGVAPSGCLRPPRAAQRPPVQCARPGPGPLR